MNQNDPHVARCEPHVDCNEPHVDRRKPDEIFFLQCRERVEFTFFDSKATKIPIEYSCIKMRK